VQVVEALFYMEAQFQAHPMQAESDRRPDMVLMVPRALLSSDATSGYGTLVGRVLDCRCSAVSDTGCGDPFGLKRDPHSSPRRFRGRSVRERKYQRNKKLYFATQQNLGFKFCVDGLEQAKLNLVSH